MQECEDTVNVVMCREQVMCHEQDMCGEHGHVSRYIDMCRGTWPCVVGHASRYMDMCGEHGHVSRYMDMFTAHVHVWCASSHI